MLSIVDYLCIAVSVLGQEARMFGDGVYEYLRPETLRTLHFYMGVGGADRFLSNIPIEQWEDVNKMAAAHVQQFCKCEGSGCLACRLMHLVGGE